MCNQDKCSFIINMSPAANVLTTSPHSWSAFNNILLLKSLKLSTAVRVSLTSDSVWGRWNTRPVSALCSHAGCLCSGSSLPAYFTDVQVCCVSAHHSASWLSCRKDKGDTFVTYLNGFSHVQIPKGLATWSNYGDFSGFQLCGNSDQGTWDQTLRTSSCTHITHSFASCSLHPWLPHWGERFQ